jgi:AraC-like DNA-binding protein
VLKGEVIISNGVDFREILGERSFLLLPSRHKYTLKMQEDTGIFIIDVGNRVNFCKHFPLELLYKLNKKKYQGRSKSLKINEIVSDYLDLFIKTFDDGLKCSYFFEIKQKELLYYLRAYYPKEDLIDFFAPILNDDVSFSELVFQNYKLVGNINELAPMANYSVSGFKKRFLKVFGMAPQHWLNEIRKKEIYFQINCTRKSFKEIALEYNFSSPAHFNSFCRKGFGMSPSVLRKNTEKNVKIPDDVSD